MTGRRRVLSAWSSAQNIAVKRDPYKQWPVHRTVSNSVVESS